MQQTLLKKASFVMCNVYAVTITVYNVYENRRGNHEWKQSRITKAQTTRSLNKKLCPGFIRS
jgi:hypothetical protein